MTLLASLGTATAQQAGNDATALTTLRVSVNLIQIPVLVLSPENEAVPGIAPERFAVSIDSGHPFSPRYARLEGDDPIEMAILLDASVSMKSLLRGMDNAVVKMAGGALTPADRVSVYTLNCKLSHQALRLEPQANLLKPVMAQAMAAVGNAPDAKGQKVRSECGRVKPLWDALQEVISDMDDPSARRVVVVVTDGQDFSSQQTPADVKNKAIDSAIAIFELTEFVGDPNEQHFPGSVALKSLCKSSGGLKIDSGRGEATTSLQQIAALLRHRYILEFPRDPALTAQRHEIKVTVSHSEAVVLPSGISLPVEKASPTQNH